MASPPIDLVCLVEAHHAAVYRYAYRLAGTVADAEDLTQQTFLVAQEKILQLRDAATARGWLYTVLRRLFLKRLRKRLPVPVSDLGLDMGEALIDEVELSQGGLGEGVDHEQLQAALGSLPEEYRLVVLMFYFEECSYREIAGELNLPIGTVMSRLSRAKDALRKRLLAEPAQPVQGSKTGREG